MSNDPIYDASQPPSSGPAPLWVWLLVLALGAVAAYAGYKALDAHQQYLAGESVRTDLAQQRDRLKANVADLTRQVEQAASTRSEVEDALKQSRANTEAASAQIADLQKQVSGLQADAAALQQKVTDLENGRSTAEASAKEAADAKDAAEKEVTALKGQLAQTKKKLDQTSAELARERAIVSPAPVGPPAEAAQ